MDSIIQSCIAELAEAIDKALVEMFERNGFTVGDYKNNINLVMLMDDLEKNGCKVVQEGMDYVLYKHDKEIDRLKILMKPMID